MLKNVIGSIIGSQVANKNPGAGGAAGAVLASAIPFVISRMRISTMVMLGLGGYLAKKYYDENEGDTKLLGHDSKSRALPKPGSSTTTGSVIDPPPGGAAKTGAKKKGGAKSTKSAADA